MTDPDGHDGASPILRISLLGGFQVAVGSRAVDDGHWRRRKVRHLIAMIALAPGCAIHREEALDRLWPDSELAAANNLYQTLHLARRALDTAMPSTGERIRLRGEMLSLAPDPPPWIEVAHFETAARHALGGGTGWLMRKHGLTIDNLLAVELVTADGRLVRASETENADLYWGVRGGGGNFGVVTAFEYRLRSVGPLVLAGPVIYTLDKAEAVLHNWAAFMATAPDDLTTFAVLLTVPPHAPFPEPLWGRQVLAVDTCYAGPIAEGEAVPKPLRAFGEPDLDLIGPMPFTVRQSMLDETGTSGMHYYDKSQFLRDIDAAIPALLARFPSVPSPRTHVILGAMGDGRWARPWAGWRRRRRHSATATLSTSCGSSATGARRKRPARTSSGCVASTRLPFRSARARSTSKPWATRGRSESAPPIDRRSTAAWLP